LPYPYGSDFKKFTIEESDIKNNHAVIQICQPGIFISAAFIAAAHPFVDLE
jgi:hypothetical protein